MTIKLTLVGGAALGAMVCGAVVLASAALARPAAQGRHFFGGVVPDVPTGDQVHRQAVAHAANLSYGGGPVLHTNRTHVIFWQPSGSGLRFDSGYRALVERFLRDVAADSRKPSNVYGLTGQYHDTSGRAAYDATYGGAVADADSPPHNGCTEPPVAGPGWTRCVSDSQLEAELARVVRARHLPRSGHDIYFMITPKGLGSCFGSGPLNCALGGQTFSGYCGYHSVTGAGLLYAVIPYNAVPPHCESDKPRPNSSTADPALSTVSHEHSEVITDPFGDAWTDSSGNEDGDLCLAQYGQTVGGSGSAAFNQVIHHHHYFLQEEWSNEDHACRQRDESDRVSFSAPSQGRVGHALTFTAQASDPDGRIEADNWFFGDHHASRGHRVSHTYSGAGTYRIVLRTTDSAGNWAYAARRIEIAS